MCGCFEHSLGCFNLCSRLSALLIQSWDWEAYLLVRWLNSLLLHTTTTKKTKSQHFLHFIHKLYSQLHRWKWERPPWTHNFSNGNEWNMHIWAMFMAKYWKIRFYEVHFVNLEISFSSKIVTTFKWHSDFCLVWCHISHKCSRISFTFSASQWFVWIFPKIPNILTRRTDSGCGRFTRWFKSLWP